MNYYQPRELKDKEGKALGLWHYTCMNDGKVWPVGYCAQGCPGHADKEGAYQHQKEYLLDTARFDGAFVDAQRPCEICKAWTSKFADDSSGGKHILCDEHRNREGLAQILEVGDVISSW